MERPMWQFDFSRVQKKYWKLPPAIQDKILRWQREVVRYGLHQVRKKPGYHDEPLQGERFGQRSIRLNRSWRLIYEIQKNDEIKIIQVVEINKHEY